MESIVVRVKSLNMNAVKIVWCTIMVAVLAAGPVLADEGVVQRTNVCRKGTLVIKTVDNEFVAAIQEGLDNVDQTPWTDNNNPRCAFFAGDRVQGDLNGAGTVTLTNSSGKACDYVIEGSGFSMQDAVEILDCE